MRVTGIVLAIAGLLAGVFCVVVLVQPTDPNQTAPTDGARFHGGPAVAALICCLVAIAVGGVMYMWGGRSFHITNQQTPQT
jgi:hypothetical protein